MLYHWLFALSFLIIVLLADFVTVAVRWDEMLVMHNWNDIPTDWESLGNTTAGATIKLHIALKPEKEGAMIDTLYEVSNPEHPRHVLVTTPPLTLVFTCVAPFQIWRISIQGTAC